MARYKTREIVIAESKGSFYLFKKSGDSKEEYDYSGVQALRQLLNKEKARLLHLIKVESPKSIYDLAKKAKRSFKSVSEDIKLLEKFGFIQLTEEKTKNRIRYKPEVVVDYINITIRV